MSNEELLTDDEPVELEAFRPLDSGLDEMIEQVKFGRSINAALSNPVVDMMITTAKKAYVASVKAFGELDLTAPNALYAAMQMQNEMKRYSDMVEWITMCVNSGTSAQAELDRRHEEEQANRGTDAYYGTEQRNN